jgi:hypothetical protein
MPQEHAGNSKIKFQISADHIAKLSGIERGFSRVQIVANLVDDGTQLIGSFGSLSVDALRPRATCYQRHCLGLPHFVSSLVSYAPIEKLTRGPNCDGAAPLPRHLRRRHDCSLLCGIGLRGRRLYTI